MIWRFTFDGQLLQVTSYSLWTKPHVWYGKFINEILLRIGISNVLISSNELASLMPYRTNSGLSCVSKCKVFLSSWPRLGWPSFQSACLECRFTAVGSPQPLGWIFRTTRIVRRLSSKPRVLRNVPFICKFTKNILSESKLRNLLFWQKKIQLRSEWKFPCVSVCIHTFDVSFVTCPCLVFWMLLLLWSVSLLWLLLVWTLISGHI